MTVTLYKHGQPKSRRRHEMVGGTQENPEYGWVKSVATFSMMARAIGDEFVMDFRSEYGSKEVYRLSEAGRADYVRVGR